MRKTTRYTPSQYPSNIKDQIDKTFNRYYQEYNVYIDDLPLYYRDRDINLNVPTIKELIESGRTFEQDVIKQIDEKFRNKIMEITVIVFGAINAPDC